MAGKMVDLSICCSEHDVSRCFSEHAGTLLMSWRSWPEPINRVVEMLQRAYIHLVDSNRRDQHVIAVSKKKVFLVWNLALAAVEL